MALTPPAIRIRSTAVPKLMLLHCITCFQQSQQVELPEVGRVKRLLQSGHSRTRPRATTSPPRAGLFFRTPQTQQFPNSRSRALPLPPDQTSHATSDPEVQLPEYALAGSGAEVVQPSSKHRVQRCLNEPSHVAAPPHMEQFFHAVAELIQTVVRYVYAHDSVYLDEGEP